MWFCYNNIKVFEYRAFRHSHFRWFTTSCFRQMVRKEKTGGFFDQQNFSAMLLLLRFWSVSQEWQNCRNNYLFCPNDFEKVNVCYIFAIHIYESDGFFHFLWSTSYQIVFATKDREFVNCILIRLLYGWYTNCKTCCINGVRLQPISIDEVVIL